MSRPPFLLALLFVLALDLSACEAPPERNPALPDGFAELRVPDAPFVALIYLDQGSDVPLAAAALDLPGEMTAGLSIERLTLLIGRNKGSMAVEIQVSSEFAARAIEQVISSGSDDAEWSGVEVDGALVLITKGDEEWAESVAEAFRTNTRIAFREAYPDAWETAQLLPESPPLDPVIIGALIDSEIVQELMMSAETSALRALGTLLNIVPSEGGVIFVGYTDRSLALDSNVDVSYVKEAKLRSVVIVRTRLLGPLLTPILGALSGALSLERLEVGELEVFRYEQDAGTALVVPRGGNLHIVVAPGGPDPDEDLLGYLDPA